MRKCTDILMYILLFANNHVSIFPPLALFWSLKIFYRVVADIAPGEELLLFMKSEDYPHDTMAPDIHGQYCSQRGPSTLIQRLDHTWRFFISFPDCSVSVLTNSFSQSDEFLRLMSC